MLIGFLGYCKNYIMSGYFLSIIKKLKKEGLIIKLFKKMKFSAKM